MDAARIAKNTGFLYIQIIVNVFVSLYSTRLILKALGVEDFGIYNLVAGVVAMLTFLNSAMAEASIRFMAYAHGEEDLNKQKNVFNVSLLLHVAIAVIVVIILEIAGYFFFGGILEIPEDRLSTAKLVYQFMLVSTFFTIIKVPYDSVLKAHENMLIVAILGIIMAIFKLMIAIYVTYTKFDQLIAYGLLMAALSVLLVISNFLYCHVKYPEVKVNIKKNFDRNLFKEMGSFASWTFLVHSVFIITMQGTTIVLNTFFGVIINAAQGIANQVSNQVKNFLGTLQVALNPVIVKSESKNDRAKMLEVSMFGNKVSFFVLSFFAIPLIIEMGTVFNFWLKEVPEFAIIFCKLQLIRLIVAALTQSFYISIGAIGDIKKYSIWESAISLAILPLSYLAYKLGASPEAIYILMVIAGAIVGIVRVFFLEKLGGLSISFFLKNVVLRCVSVFGITMFIGYLPMFFMGVSVWRFLLVGTFSSLSFLGFAYIFGFNNTEKKQLVKAVATLVKKKIN